MSQASRTARSPEARSDRPYQPQTHIAQAAAKREVLTGLLYLTPDSEDLHAHLNTFPTAFNTAFNTLGAKELCPGSGMLEKINAGLR